MAGDARNVINAEPTKEFFIDMLVKDIGLSRAIIDLVDNCVDGAKRIRPDGDFSGLHARIELSDSQFRITDNCGGIDVKTATQYAFRFGRPASMKTVPHSIGQFGVGMKRALFKIGKQFRVESTTGRTKFTMTVDVDKWKKDDDWSFRFASVEPRLSALTAPDQRGTTITVTQLHASVSESFETQAFETQLARELQEAHVETVDSGLTIILNAIPIHVRPPVLLQSARLQPGYWSKTYRLATPVTVKLYCGIADAGHSNPREAGWSVFCNGRLVLTADKTSQTGWGDGIPNYHNQYSLFRGFAFFDSDDASLLPWNTTKTGVDMDASLFKAVRLEMKNMMQPVIAFLNDLDREREHTRAQKADPGPIERVIKDSKPVKMVAIRSKRNFTGPAPTKRAVEPENMRISYSRPVGAVAVVQRKLRAKTLKEVGERTFDYYYEMECE